MAVSYTRNDKIVSRRFYAYLIPTVLMILAMQFGSLADAIVIGNFLGEQALSASSLALPIVFLVQVPAMAIASGGAIVGANLLGKRRIEDASKVFKLGLFLVFVGSLIFLPLGLFAMPYIASFFAGNFQELTPLITQYSQIYCYQAPIIGAGIFLAYFLPSDNNPNLGALFFIISNVVHIGSEILFCVLLDKSVVMYGVAASMGIGCLAGYVVFIPYLLSKKRAIDLKAPFKGSFAFTKDLLKAGSSAGALTAVLCVYSLVLNLAATAYLKDAELPVYAMLTNFSFVVDLFVLGVFQVMPSVVSALYGEKDYFGVRSVTKRVFIIGLSVTALITAISLVFPELFFIIFGVNLADIRSAIAQYATPLPDPLLVVRIYCISFLLYSTNRFLVNYYPSIMVNAPAVVSNLLRPGIIGPLSVYFLMMATGVLGFSIGSIIMEATALLVTIVLVLVGKKLGKFHGKGLLLIPEPNPNEQSLDISIPAKEEEISKVVEDLQAYAQEITGDAKAAAMMALATEEILANTIEYGYRHKASARFIDVNVTKTEVGLQVRVRDDGLNFDPTSFEVDGKDEEYRYHGIEVVRKVASTFKYLRLLNMNNTIMEISVTQ